MKAFELIPILLQNPNANIFATAFKPSENGIDKPELVEVPVDHVTTPWSGLGGLYDPHDESRGPSGPRLVFHIEPQSGHDASGKMSVDTEEPERNIFGFVKAPVVQQVLAYGKSRKLGRPEAAAEILLKVYRMLTIPFSSVRFHLFNGTAMDVTGEKMTIHAAVDDTTVQLEYTANNSSSSPNKGWAETSQK